jgi:Phage tail sheath C-terminal domain
MALNSPGVEVQVIDESFYVPAAPGTRPLIIVASQQNKQNASGTGIAVGTLAANAGKPYLITSQRELTDTFGTPLFYKDSSQNPIHGGELNEYGLQAAYSYLGVSNSAYVVRSDLDLVQLEPQATAPGGKPVDGTYWFDTQNTRFGIFQWDGDKATVKGGQSFTNQIPTVITDTTKVDPSNGFPLASIGKIGDYAVVSITTLNQIFYKNRNNSWVLLGSAEWYMSWPVVTSTAINPTTIRTGMSFFVNGVEIVAGHNGTPATLAGLVTLINAASDAMTLRGITAAVVDGRLELYSDGATDNMAMDSTLSNEIVITQGTAVSGKYLVTALGTDSILGITTGTYLGPALQISPHTSVPVFKRKDLINKSGGIIQQGRPSGSVWIKTTDVNLGARWRIKEWSSQINDWINVDAPVYSTNQEAIFKLDRVGGGKNIAQGNLFVQFDVGEDSGTDDTPRIATFKIYRREQPDPTQAVSNVITSTTFTASKTYEFWLGVSEPGSPYLTPDYHIQFTANGANSDAAAMVTAINGAMIPNIVAEVDSRNRVVIRHEIGGEIRVRDGVIYVATSTVVNHDQFVVGHTYQIKTVSNGIGGDSDFTLVGAANNTIGTQFVATGTDAGGTGTAYETAAELAPMSMIYTPYNVDTSSGTASFYFTPTNSPIDTGSNTYVISGDDPSNYANRSGGHDYVITNWKPLKYTASYTAPSPIPADGTLWFNPVLDEVDIMIHNGVTWVGYLDSTSPNYSSDPALQTDPNGPLVTATKPTTQSDGTELKDGDLWVDSGDRENYPALYRWDGFNLKWIAIDMADQTSENGILFADARYNTAGANSDLPGAIPDMLVSNYVDTDAPDPALYPRGMLLFNTRRSGNNVKRFVHNYIDRNADNIRYNGVVTVPVTTSNGESQDSYAGDDQAHPNLNVYNRWVNESGNADDGMGLFGRKAQRKVVVKHLKAMVDTNQDLREQEIRTFNLIACPGYVELISNMVNLNLDRRQTAFVIGDTPFRLPSDATSLNNWGSHADTTAVDNGEKALVTYDEYLGVYYPSGYTTDNFGNDIVVPPSHMVLRTIALSDNVSYPWFAPAGTRRGAINNATAVGYVSAEDGEFKSISLNEGQRDTLYAININPITFLTGAGIVIYGQKTRAKNASSLDRVNVARLVVYLRGQLTKMAKPYIFEPNDKITRDEIKSAAESIMLELVGQRALYDYLVVCDDSNNTPSRIDRNELYLDIAIEPVKAVEFIYIPLRLKNTGEIAGLGSK